MNQNAILIIVVVWLATFEFLVILFYVTMVTIEFGLELQHRVDDEHHIDHGGCWVHNHNCFIFSYTLPCNHGNNWPWPFIQISAEEQMMNQNTILIMVVVGLAVVVFLVILYCFQQRQRRNNRGNCVCHDQIIWHEVKLCIIYMKINLI